MAATIILALTVVVSLAGLWLWPRIIVWNLFRPYWFLRQRQFWTPLGSVLVHADLGHLLFNALTFWAFAFPLERRIGSARLLALYACGIAASDAGTWFRHRNDPEYACLGASGAILAVLFASIVYYPRQSITDPAAAAADPGAAVRRLLSALQLLRRPSPARPHQPRSAFQRRLGRTAVRGPDRPGGMAAGAAVAILSIIDNRAGATLAKRALRRPRAAGARDPLFNQSVQKAFAILEAFGGERRALNLAEIAELVGVTKSSAQRCTTRSSVSGC